MPLASEPIQQALLELEAVTEGLSQNDVSFHCTIDAKIAERVRSNTHGILACINQLIHAVDEHAPNLGEGKNAIKDEWKTISNVLDLLYEKLDIEFDALVRPKDPQIQVEEKEVSRTRKKQPKPQLNFRVPVDNSENGPFKPRLTSKPHALEPFEESMQLVVPENGDPVHYRQPYEKEIDTQEYPEHVLEAREPIPSKPWVLDQEPVWVDSKEGLAKMISELSKCSEIAVDLEHHDLRTYYGLTCLMQISSRTQDWLIDTLALRDDLTPLNEIFADPKIVKVFHGAFMDIIWLQRDLGLYIVSLFDTFHASRELGLAKHSLAFLLEKYASFQTNKKFQLADWRVRPLTPQMKLYARADTHFLLNIYDQMRNALIKKGSLNIVLHESRKVARQRFEYYLFRPSERSPSVVTSISDKIEPWQVILNKFHLNMTKKSLVMALYNWRDSIARRDDESVKYVMPDPVLVAIVGAAPTDSAGVLAASFYVTDHIRLNADAIADVVARTLKESQSEDLQLLNSVDFEASEAVIDERAIYANISGFGRLLKGLEGSLTLRKPQVIESKIFVDRPKFWAQNSKGEKITLPQIQRRFPYVYGALLKLQKVVVEVPEEEPVSAEIKKPEEEPKESKNDIIVVRRGATRKKNKLKVNMKSSDDVVDYSSADKIMLDQMPTEKRQGKKRRGFDPYGGFEGARGKKRRAPVGDKNISYK